MIPDRVIVGRVGRPHGLSGEVVVIPDTDNPHRFRPGATVYAAATVEHRLVVQAVRHRRESLLVAFESLHDREAAETLRGAVLTIEASERRRLEPGEFWPDQLEGLEVRDPAGNRLGVVTEAIATGSQDRLEVELAGGRRVDVPFVGELVPEVRPDEGYVVVVPLDGLLSSPPDRG